MDSWVDHPMFRPPYPASDLPPEDGYLVCGFCHRWVHPAVYHAHGAWHEVPLKWKFVHWFFTWRWLPWWQR
jgi:hypothetical protein